MDQLPETGSVNVLVVERGAIGSAATNHSSGDTTRLFSGGYNIVDSTIHFTEPPKGDANATQKTQANLDPVRSTFNGRVYLRQDYSEIEYLMIFLVVSQVLEQHIH